MIAVTTLRAEPASPGVARRFVADALLNRGFPDAGIEQAVLLTSELVTNAIVHAGSEVRLVVLADPSMARVEVHDGHPEVHDGHPEPPLPGEPDGETGAGLGLRVIEALSEAWGVERLESGRCVWFEVRP